MAASCQARLFCDDKDCAEEGSHCTRPRYFYECDLCTRIVARAKVKVTSPRMMNRMCVSCNRFTSHTLKERERSQYIRCKAHRYNRPGSEGVADPGPAGHDEEEGSSEPDPPPPAAEGSSLPPNTELSLRGSWY
ncbi:hypothetical protein O181_102737 [Austropuccinia psidii MF-1]|uniref:Uncharacterized protein n=1 Tax=Austropuccinia psidii MF-1 TaxID=1389203 RepID=A0A9Q3JIF6_9BASI|nr:hypothetical protein [Austropuccinia psidii MF-1]